MADQDRDGVDARPEGRVESSPDGSDRSGPTLTEQPGAGDQQALADGREQGQWVSGRARDKARKRKRRLYQIIREELQLSGDLPTVPGGALRSEVVRAEDQGDQPLPQLTEKAIRAGWAVPEEKKPGLVDEMVKMVEGEGTDGKVKVAAFRALLAGDREQRERDRPAQGGIGGAGAGVNVQVNIQQNIEGARLIREAIERGELGMIEEAQDGKGSEVSGGG